MTTTEKAETPVVLEIPLPCTVDQLSSILLVTGSRIARSMLHRGMAVRASTELSRDDIAMVAAELGMPIIFKLRS